MLVPFVEISPLALALVLIGILTLFGKKKKEEKQGESKGQPATPSGGVGSDGTVAGAGLSSGIEDSSLNKILQSLMEDIPQPSENDRASSDQLATPEWVPPRATPRSRPMVIAPGEKGEMLVDEAVAAKRPQKTSEAEVHAPSATVEPVGFSSFPKLAGLEDEMRRLEDEVKKRLEAPEKVVKPEKVERVEKAEPQAKDRKLEKKREPEKGDDGKPRLGFEHVFELTKDALKSPGLVLVSGPEGSGKTTFCSGLVAAYLGQGSPCLLVVYDRSPGDARDGLKKLGCDVSGFESRFRFLLVDGFSAQSEAFSMEPYYVEKPFDFAGLTETVVRNAQVFMGERVGVVLDSLDAFVSRVQGKDLVKGLRELVERVKEAGAVLVVALDSKGVSKELEGPLGELAGCWVELEKEGKGGRFRVRKLEGSSVKAEAELFEFDAGKGLVFV